MLFGHLRIAMPIASASGSCSKLYCLAEACMLLGHENYIQYNNMYLDDHIEMAPLWYKTYHDHMYHTSVT